MTIRYLTEGTDPQQIQLEIVDWGISTSLENCNCDMPRCQNKCSMNLPIREAWHSADLWGLAFLVPICTYFPWDYLTNTFLDISSVTFRALRPLFDLRFWKLTFNFALEVVLPQRPKGLVQAEKLLLFNWIHSTGFAVYAAHWKAVNPLNEPTKIHRKCVIEQKSRIIRYKANN